MGGIRRALVSALLVATLVPLVPAAAAQNDAGSGTDAPGDFSAALPVAASGRFAGRVDPGAGDALDAYRFFVAEGAPIDVEVDAGYLVGYLQVSDSPWRPGVRLYDPNGLLLDTPNSNIGDSRVTWPRALVAGEYRLVFDAQFLPRYSYSFCFVVTPESCAIPGMHPIGLSAPLPSTHAEVLLVPPLHGNPLGPETALDYADATLRGIRAWKPAIDVFAERYPAHAHLKQLTVHVEVFDGVAPKRAGYDVVVVWGEYTGPIFRGVAVNALGRSPLHQALCATSLTCPRYDAIEPVVHDSTRLIVMSLFAAAPRAGQVTPDWPEVNDVENVAMHEFAHTWGLGHTTTWTTTHGPDLMNSPYAAVFGDGDALGDGGERTPLECITSLDLYGLSRLYEWVGRGVPYNARQAQSQAWLPSTIPYEMYCASHG